MFDFSNLNLSNNFVVKTGTSWLIMQPIVINCYYNCLCFCWHQFYERTIYNNDTHLKSTVWWILTVVHTCGTMPSLRYRAFPNLPKNYQGSFSSVSLCLPLDPGNHLSAYCHYKLIFILYKWNHTVCVLCVCVTMHKEFKINPCSHSYQ